MSTQTRKNTPMPRSIPIPQNHGTWPQSMSIIAGPPPAPETPRGASVSPEAPPWRRLERVAGIEPASQAWEACALPLDDTRARRFSYQIARDLSTETASAAFSLADMGAHPGQHATGAQGSLGLADL